MNRMECTPLHCAPTVEINAMNSPLTGSVTQCFMLVNGAERNEIFLSEEKEEVFSGNGNPPDFLPRTPAEGLALCTPVTEYMMGDGVVYPRRRIRSAQL